MLLLQTIEFALFVKFRFSLEIILNVSKMAATGVNAVYGDGNEVRLETSGDQNGVVQPLLTGNYFLHRMSLNALWSTFSLNNKLQNYQSFMCCNIMSSCS